MSSHVLLRFSREASSTDNFFRPSSVWMNVCQFALWVFITPRSTDFLRNYLPNFPFNSAPEIEKFKLHGFLKTWFESGFAILVMDGNLCFDLGSPWKGRGRPWELGPICPLRTGLNLKELHVNFTKFDNKLYWGHGPGIRFFSILTVNKVRYIKISSRMRGSNPRTRNIFEWSKLKQ